MSSKAYAAKPSKWEMNRSRQRPAIGDGEE
jgi:hypothetical protein